VDLIDTWQVSMKIDKGLINSYPFTIRPLKEEEGGRFVIV
jgi:hypothetical protein